MGGREKNLEKKCFALNISEKKSFTSHSVEKKKLSDFSLEKKSLSGAKNSHAFAAK